MERLRLCAYRKLLNRSWLARSCTCRSFLPAARPAALLEERDVDVPGCDVGPDVEADPFRDQIRSIPTPMPFPLSSLASG
jgi:hypothetical protein